MCHKSCGSRKQVTGNGFRRCACGGVMLYVSGAGKLCRMGKGGWSLFYRHPGLDSGSFFANETEKRFSRIMREILNQVPNDNRKYDEEICLFFFTAPYKICRRKATPCTHISHLTSHIFHNNQAICLGFIILKPKT